MRHSMYLIDPHTNTHKSHEKHELSCLFLLLMDNKIQQMRRHFGGALDVDALTAVLLMHDDDVNAAIAFLSAESGSVGCVFLILV